MVSQYPVFQQTSIINYKNEICVVTVNGYKNMSAGTSMKIAKSPTKFYSWIWAGDNRI